MKSSKVGKNHRRRQLILKALMPLPFKIFSVCIDKRLCLENMNAQGLKYKTSFNVWTLCPIQYSCVTA